MKFTNRFVFGSKAETLQYLNAKLEKSRIPPFIFFTLSEWKKSPEIIVNKIKALSETVIVRSSAYGEDGELYAHAGQFLSIPHIDARNNNDLNKAIEEVFESYKRLENNINESDQVIVQEMTDGVSMSGVIFTRILSTGAPYYVINYDDESGDTASITSGCGYNNRTLYVHRNHHGTLSSHRFHKTISAVKEIEEITGETSLDIEFAIQDDNETVAIFQVRKLTLARKWSRGLKLRIDDTLQRLKESIGSTLYLSSKNRKERTIYGKMPDWNPAEIIGDSPGILSFSLYRYVITDKVWRMARSSMGYEDCIGAPLMVSCAGQPYINVRRSFESFIPATLDDSIANFIVDKWLEVLAANPLLHDKVEFKVAITSWSFDFEEKMQTLLPKELTDIDKECIRNSYKELTFDLVQGKKASIEEQFEKINQLKGRQKNYQDLIGRYSYQQICRILLDDCIQYGTLPFAVLARHAFIAKTLLDSLVTNSLISKNDHDSFNRSLNTIAHQYIKDAQHVSDGSITREEFNQNFGHLRPGTYDILSLRYDQRTAQVSSRKNHVDDSTIFELAEEKSSKLNEILGEVGMKINAEQLFDYIRKAIEYREWAKLIFSKNISDILEILAEWGRINNLSREELMHIDIREFLDSDIHLKGRSVESYFREIALDGVIQHEVSTAVKLPSVLLRDTDIFIAPMMLEEPNYITTVKVTANIIHVTGRDTDLSSLDDCIVAIESADPGYDWIFTRNIVGLITQYGGANSHMAIRCAEFNIPAAIGCGEQIFQRVVNSSVVELNTVNSTIKSIS